MTDPYSEQMTPHVTEAAMRVLDLMEPHADEFELAEQIVEVLKPFRPKKPQAKVKR